MDFKAKREADPEHWRLATAIRVLAMDAVEAAQSGHPGMPMGMADVATVLFREHLKFDAASPHWFDRDRFVLSAGHGSMLLYALLYLTGYEQMTLEQIRNFRQLGAITAGHPEYGHVDGVETTTGPLGQGLATSVGMAIAEEAFRAEYGAELCDHRTWVIAGDGCLMEGISQEALSLAGAQQLGKLIVLWDNNDITIDGRVELADRTNQRDRFAASGWRVLSCDGNDVTDIRRALTEAAAGDGRPTFVDCKTIIGFGAPTKADTAKAHGSPLGADEIAAARKNYGWTAPAFEIPKDLLDDWRQIGARGRAARQDWDARVTALSSDSGDEFRRRIDLRPNPALDPLIVAMKVKAAQEKPKIATRKASENVLAVLNPEMPENFGGSADLTGSNNTLTPGMGIFDPGNRLGRYIHYGIREHGMAAAMNGIWLHGGFRPYGGTFLTFTDYARGGIRLSALMGLPVVYVMTHDSIGLGEDGPTHQPVEHLAIARATPNLLVLRPCDEIETAEAWQIALSQTSRPSVLALSRQNLPTLRITHRDENLSAKGAYVLREAVGGKPQVILMASGSEVEIATAARDLLEAEGIAVRVVSVPSMELFRDASSAWRQEVLPGGTVRIAIEAAVRQPWDWLLLGEGGREDKSAFVGMTGFGASGPAGELYREFGITAEAVAEKAKGLL
ncbi:transketolase [Paracoccus caeni]|uniref:Transketolase n=1 Tax=Paracoccus caeni TaxID=657651 RepID=A0A934SL31_9RHOB|nr:transketolase [Paracoccus caeni]MBK4217237.1 transketolase [Paracoccus caeni]